MTTSNFFIFMAGLLVLNIAVLYAYFFYCESKSYGQIHGEYVPSSLKKAGLIQALFVLGGETALFFLSEDKIWYDSSKFLFFIGLTAFVGLIGIIEEDGKIKKILAGAVELAAMMGFIFLLPKNEFFTKTSLDPEVFKIIIGIVWFILFKFICVLNKLEGLVAAVSFHVGFSFLLILLFFSFPAVALLQNGILLFPLMFLLAPLYYVLEYDIPLKSISRNIFAITITGLALFMALTGNWGIGVLMLTYIFFEIIVFSFRLVRNFVTRKKEPLFFYQILQEKGASDSLIIGFILRRNVLTMALILFIMYVSVQLQAVLLAALLYLKLYFNVMNPNSSKSSLIDLFKQAKTDAKKGFKETNKAFSELKGIYQDKTVKSKEENKADE